MTANQQDELLSLAEARRILGVSDQWFRKLRQSDDVPGEIVVGKHPVFRKSEFLPWSKTYLNRPKKRSKLMKQ